MSCSARICSCAAATLVLLRLAVGWHFFMEGSEKLSDKNWSSAGFLLEAKGPLADFYHSQVPQVHNWRTLLAVPPTSDLSDAARADAVREWQTAYTGRRDEARAAGQPEPFEVEPYHPFSVWATQITQDWKTTLDRFVQLPHISDVHVDQAEAALVARRVELLAYFREIEPEIAKFHSEVTRIRSMANRDEAGEVPYYGNRIQSLQSEALRTPQPWLADVTAIENAYFADLRAIHREAQDAAEEKQNQANEAAGSDETALPRESNGGAQTEASPPPQNEAANAQITNEAETREGMPPEPAEAGASATAAPAAAAEATGDQDGTTPVQGTQNPEAAPPGTDADAQPAASSEAAGETAAADGDGEEPMTLADVFVDNKAANLALVDKVVTWLTLGVGACLVVGLFVPLAGFAGAVFLAAVISTQPPWVPEAQETYYQFVEMFSLLVLACTCAGRWAGLDYFFAVLFSRGGRSQ